MVSQKVETKRIKACSRVAIEKFFRDVVDPMMEEHQFKPQNTWNFDETMLGYSNRRSRVVVSRSSKTAIQLEPDQITDHTTMGFCISASGEMMKPAVITKKKFLDRKLDFLVVKEKWHFCHQKVAGCPTKHSEGGQRTFSYHTSTTHSKIPTNRWSTGMDHEHNPKSWSYSPQTKSTSS